MKTTAWLGKPISFPGVYSGIDLNAYHAAGICAEVSISSSGLRKITSESPAHYWADSPYNENRIEREPSEALWLGSATHHLLLGEEEFREKFEVMPIQYPDYKTAKAREWKAATLAAGKIPLRRDDLTRIDGMCSALARHPLVRAGILNGLIEQSMFWKDEKTGVWLKARPDALPNDSFDFVDLKTTGEVSYRAMQTTIREYGYHQQGALILEGARRLLKAQQPTFTLVFIESRQPHCVAVVTLKPEDLARGHKLNHIALATFAKCYEEKNWPGPFDDQRDAAYIELPSWEQENIDAMPPA